LYGFLLLFRKFLSNGDARIYLRSDFSAPAAGPAGVKYGLTGASPVRGRFHELGRKALFVAYDISAPTKVGLGIPQLYRESFLFPCF
jgi:hypothetical protein